MSDRIFQCNVPGFGGSVTFHFFSYPVWMAFRKVVFNPIFATQMAGDDIDLKAAYTTFWAGIAVLESWDITTESGDSIPKPEKPEDATNLHWSLFEWFRVTANNYILPEVNPSQKKLP